MKKALISVVAALVGFSGCGSPGISGLGVRDGRFTPCPASPNCVSTQSPDEAQRMEAIPYGTSRDEARKRLLDILRGAERTRIITERDDYIHAEFVSAFFRFVDDVEFYLDDEGKRIEFRSASRIGNYDFGVNRKRMESLKHRFLNP